MRPALSVCGILFGICILGACSSNPIIEDRMPRLDPGQGIAALVFDTPMRVTHVAFVPESGHGETLNIDVVPPGRSLFLFVTPIGRYCLHQFYTNDFYTAEHADQCFEVKAGGISYGGNFTPIAGINSPGSDGGMSQGRDMLEFLKLLKQDYPNIAAAILQEGGSKPVSHKKP